MSQRDFQQTLRSPTCYPDLATTPISDDKDAYERVVTDAMAGDATLFARQDYVEKAWHIVDQSGAD